MLLSSALLILFSVYGLKKTLHHNQVLDLSPANHWPIPSLATPSGEQSPVLIQIKYEVREECRDTFLQELQILKSSRLAHRAVSWSYMQDTEDSNAYIEQFQESDREAHLRHHDRVSHEDKVVQDRIRICLKEDTRPFVQHFLIKNIS